MSQRDTLIPVCKIITVAADALTTNIPMANTGISVANIVSSEVSAAPVSQALDLVVSAFAGQTTAASAALHMSTAPNTNNRLQLYNMGLYDARVLGKGFEVSTPAYQIYSVKLEGSAGGVGFGKWGADPVRVHFPSSGAAGAQTTSAVVVVADSGVPGSRVATVASPGNYDEGTTWDAFAGNALFGDGANQQLVLSSVAGDASAVFSIVSGNTSGLFTVTTTDQVGSPNYITVTDLSGDGGYFRVAPSSGTAAFYASGAGGVRDRVPEVSGVGGVIAAAGSTAVLSLMKGINYIDIENHLEDSSLAAMASVFAINYGIVKQSNTIGDAQALDVR